VRSKVLTGVAEDSDLLGCGTVWLGEWFLKFQGKTVLIFGVKQSQKNATESPYTAVSLKGVQPTLFQYFV